MNAANAHLCKLPYGYFLSFLLATIVTTSTSASELKPFTSDGCSHFPEGTHSHQALWLSCCTMHDIAYWQGGVYAERTAADKALRQCVAAVGEPQIAVLMLAGVRVGGTPYLPTSFRWGYGWPYLRGYRALSTTEKTAVQVELDKLNLNAPAQKNEIDTIKDDIADE